MSTENEGVEMSPGAFMEVATTESDEWFPTRVTGTCEDCGTTMTCEHPGGIGGEGDGWVCLVCGDQVRMVGSDHTKSGDLKTLLDESFLNGAKAALQSSLNAADRLAARGALAGLPLVLGSLLANVEAATPGDMDDPLTASSDVDVIA